MKKLLSLLVCVLMCVGACAAEETGASTLTMEELTSFVADIRALAMDSTPFESEGNRLTEEGYEFRYDFGTVYADTPALSMDSEINAVVLSSTIAMGPREIQVGDGLDVVLNAFYQENENLLGSREAAVLYSVAMLPDSAQYGLVSRDGQRVQTVQYALHELSTTGGEGYTDAGVLFTFSDNAVSAIRVYGLNARATQAQVEMALTQVENLALEQGYALVPSSWVGSELAAFGGEDLQFSGLDFMSLTPDTAATVLGEAFEDVWVEDGENGFIRSIGYADCEIAFRYDANRENPEVYMLTIASEAIEGPRAARVGDTFHQVYNRFRNGEGTYDGSTRELLYGDEAEGTYGVVDYADTGDATMRFGLVLEDGVKVALHMDFEMARTGMLTLTQMMLYIAE